MNIAPIELRLIDFEIAMQDVYDFLSVKWR